MDLIENVFYVKDILHSGRGGEARTQKKGVTYEGRKNQFCKINLVNDFGEKQCIISLYEDKELSKYNKSIVTTKFIDIVEKDEIVELITDNSIYVLEKVEK